MFALTVNRTNREARAIRDFEGPNVKGSIKEYRPRAMARFFPNFLKTYIAEQHFKTPDSAHVSLYLNQTDFHRYLPQPASSGGLTVIDPSEEKLKQEAAQWLRELLPSVSILGLN